MKFIAALSVSLLSSLLIACTSKEASPVAFQVTTEQTASDLTTSTPTPRVGSSLQNMLKPADAQLAQLKAQYADYTPIEWGDLELPGQSADDIVNKYQAQIHSMAEGDPGEKALLAQMQQEMNKVPINPILNGKKIKLPGFVLPLVIDEQKGMINEFLLVPRYGSCIHTPPPPLNNTVLVKPIAGRSIGMERVYEPVWVYGTLSTTTTHTHLGEAGYQLLEAKVERYEVDKETETSAKP